MRGDERTGALVNGALISLGALAVVDNVVFHWLLGLHRAVPGTGAEFVEVGLVALGVAMLALGLWLERKARKR